MDDNYQFRKTIEWVNVGIDVEILNIATFDENVLFFECLNVSGASFCTSYTVSISYDDSYSYGSGSNYNYKCGCYYTTVIFSENHIVSVVNGNECNHIVGMNSS